MSTLLYKLFIFKKYLLERKKHVMKFVTCFFLNIGFFVYTCYNKKRNNIAKERDYNERLSTFV